MRQNSQQKYNLGIFENTKEDDKILVYKGKSIIQNGIRFSAAWTGQKQDFERPQEIKDQLRIPWKVKILTLV